MILDDSNNLRLRRPGGGLTGTAAKLACHFDFGISSSSTEAPQNQVTTEGAAGANSPVQATGANSSGAAGSTGSVAFAPVTVVASGGVSQNIAQNGSSVSGTGGGAAGSGGGSGPGGSVNLNQSVNYYNADSTLAQSAIEGSSDVAGYAVQAEGQTAANALTFGLGAEQTALQAQNNAFGFGAEVVNDALASNSATSAASLNDIASFANLGLQTSNDIASQALQSNSQLGSDLAAITASAVPLNAQNQSAVIGAEGSVPAGAGNFSTYLWIGIGLMSLYVFASSGGKST